MLKDHRCHEALRLAQNSYYHAVKVAAFKKGIVLPDTVSNFDNVPKTPTTLVFGKQIDCSVKRELLKAMKDIKFVKLDVNMVNEDQEEGKFQFYYCIFF